MINDTILTILRFAYLFLLWGFVISLVLLLRTDIFEKISVKVASSQNQRAGGLTSAAGLGGAGGRVDSGLTSGASSLKSGASLKGAGGLKSGSGLSSGAGGRVGTAALAESLKGAGSLKSGELGGDVADIISGARMAGSAVGSGARLSGAAGFDGRESLSTLASDLNAVERGIEVVAGIAKGDFISLANADEEFSATIGRGLNATVRLDDPSVSEMHARLFGERGNIYVEDLGSTNGTVVDGNAITGPVRVVNDSMIRIGKNIMEVRL